MIRESLLFVLQKYYVRVTFTKVDGTTRNMLCTLRPDQLPETKGKIIEVSDEVIRVWNVDLQAWRSFRVDSVTKFVWSDGENEYVWTKNQA